GVESRPPGRFQLILSIPHQTMSIMWRRESITAHQCCEWTCQLGLIKLVMDEG
ncbi:hypothetical protein EE612_046228, partial [Oryza sativa]